MSERRHLVLRKESLTELHTDELARVVGAAATTPVTGCLRTVLSEIEGACVESIIQTCVSTGGTTR